MNSVVHSVLLEDPCIKLNYSKILLKGNFIVGTVKLKRNKCTWLSLGIDASLFTRKYIAFALVFIASLLKIFSSMSAKELIDFLNDNLSIGKVNVSL